MRKHYLIVAAAMVVSMGATAQKTCHTSDQRGFMMVSGGPAFALGEFGSTDINLKQPGFAKTGYNINLNAGYLFTQHIGMGVNAFYANHAYDNAWLKNANGNLRADHWEYTGVVAGLLVSTPISSVSSVDLNVMTGAVDFNSPRTTYKNQEIISEAWAVVAPLKVDANFRYTFNKRMQAIAGVNYLYADPRFNVNVIGTTSGETPTTSTESFHQVISVLGVHAGIGVSFK